MYWARYSYSKDIEWKGSVLIDRTNYRNTWQIVLNRTDLCYYYRQCLFVVYTFLFRTILFFLKMRKYGARISPFLPTNAFYFLFV